MALDREFPVRRRPDGSIDSAFYEEHADRLRIASFAAAMRWLMSRLQPPTGRQPVIRRRPA